MRARGKLALCVALCTGLSCSDDVRRATVDISTVFATDAGEVETQDAGAMPMLAVDAGASAAALRCPSMWADCAGASAPWRVIAEASQFGADASFEALAGDLVLVRGGSAPWRVLRFGPDLSATQVGSVSSFAFPSGAWNPVGLARGQGSEPSVEVLACAPSGVSCVLLQAPLSDPSPLREQSALPADFVALGLRAAGPMLCAFGSGIRCLDRGTWTESLRLPPQERVVALVLASPRSLALTQTGRVFSGALQDALPVWVEEAPVADVSQLDVAAGRALFHGSSTLVERTASSDTVCEVPAGVAAAFLSLGGARRSVLTQAGELLSAPDAEGGFCRSARVSLAQPVRAASSGACGEDGDLRVITATQLIGDNSCARD
jgi:hypothetical protein